MTASDVVEWAMLIICVFAVIAQFTPNSSDNKIAQMLLDAINVLGQNNGKAKNDPRIK